MSTATVDLSREPTLAALEDNVERLVAAGESYPNAEGRARALARAEMRKRLEAGIPLFQACEIPGKIAMPLDKTQAAVETYNRERAGKGPSHEAPAKLTHRGVSAEGWVSQLYMRGATVFGKIKNATRTLCDALIEGKYPNRSAELEPEGRSFDGFAFLGGEAPAIRLANFSADSTASRARLAFQFAVSSDELALTPTQGVTMADQDTKPDATVQVNFGAAPASPAAGTPPPPGGRTFSADEFKAEEERIKREAKAELEREFKASQFKAQAAADDAKVEELILAKKVAPGNREYAKSLLAACRTADAAEGASPLTFAAGDGTTVKRSLADETLRRLEAATEGDDLRLFGTVVPRGTEGLPVSAPEAPELDGMPAQKRMAAKLEFGLQTKAYIEDKATEHKLSFRNASIVHGVANDEGLSFEAALKQVRNQLPRDGEEGN